MSKLFIMIPEEMNKKMKSDPDYLDKVSCLIEAFEDSYAEVEKEIQNDNSLTDDEKFNKCLYQSERISLELQDQLRSLTPHR